MKKPPAVRNLFAAMQSKKPPVGTLTRQSSCNIRGVLSCLSHSYRHQQTLDKAMRDFQLLPIWGFHFSCWCQRFCETADEIKLHFSSWSLGCSLVELTLRPWLLVKWHQCVSKHYLLFCFILGIFLFTQLPSSICRHFPLICGWRRHTG